MLPNETIRYLQTPRSLRRPFLKEQYLRHLPNTSRREQALYQFERLVEFTRRLNFIECKSAIQPTIKPSLLIENDLFVSVEVCVECIHESGFLRDDEESSKCWVALLKFIESIKSKPASDKTVQASFLLIYLAALIFRRRILDNSAEGEPEIFTIAEEYGALAKEFQFSLFRADQSSSTQLRNLTENLKNLDSAFNSASP